MMKNKKMLQKEENQLIWMLTLNCLKNYYKNKIKENKKRRNQDFHSKINNLY